MSRRRIAFHTLTPGLGVLYFGPRHGLLRRRGVGIAQILALDPECEVVHVRTFVPARVLGPRGVIDVGFLPLAFAAFTISVCSLEGAYPVPTDFWPALSIWRKERDAGTAGIFAVPLWEAAAMARETVTESGVAGHVTIEYAYPVRRDRTEPFTVVRAVC